MNIINKSITRLTLIALFLANCSVLPTPDGPSSSSANDVSITAFTHVNIVPMTAEIVLENQTVLVKGSKIIAIGPADEISIPTDVAIIDGEGSYLMPGLADMHMHTRQDWESDNWPVSPLVLYIANGVTTIRDFGPSGEVLTYALKWREQIQAGTLIGPTIYASGRILFVSPLGDPQGLVRENHDLGFDFLKLYSYLSPEDAHEALTTAKELDFYSAGHVPYAIGLENILSTGMDEIAHVEELLPEFIEFDRNRELSPDEWLPYLISSGMQQFEITAGFSETDFNRQHGDTLARIIEQLHSAGAPVCTTMAVDDVIQLKLFQPQSFLDRPESQYSPVGYLDLFRRGEEKHQLQFREIEDMAAYKYGIDRWILAGLHQGGIPLLLGTDAGTGGMGIVPGFSIHDELRILVENGFSPYEAIATGTVNASTVVERMVGEGDFGTIEVGKRADLILVKNNPLEDVANIEDIRGVMAAGRWYSEEELDQMIALE
ncbi:MAG: amidohydrolase family protein [Chloroflexota bacterium]|nr:amidohydrolase family protein [Chloroflexota bacterium]